MEEVKKVKRESARNRSKTGLNRRTFAPVLCQILFPIDMFPLTTGTWDTSKPALILQNLPTY